MDWPVAPGCPSPSLSTLVLGFRSPGNPIGISLNPGRALHPPGGRLENYTSPAPSWEASWENFCKSFAYIFTSSFRQPHKLGHTGLI